MNLLNIFVICILVGSSIAGPHVNRANDEHIEKEFLGEDDQAELELLREQFTASHGGNVTYIDIPTEIDVNTNNTELYEGDINLTPEQWKIVLDFNPENPRSRRQALTDFTSLWKPLGAPVIPYHFLPDFPENHRDVVREALTFWEQRTCIKFRPGANGDNEGIVFNPNGAGCSSMIGSSNYWQQLSLAPHCMNVPIITHELSHAFGTAHVQSREDRDTYVRVDTTNVADGHEYDFSIRTETKGYSTYGIPYEFGSIMHYPPNIFAKDSRKPTIYAIPPYQKYQGSMDGPLPTFWDTVLINRMYKCTDKCTTQMDCKNGGVTDGSDCNKCFCPRGWSGTYCERRPANAQIINLSDTPQNVLIALNEPFSSFQEKLIVLQAPEGKTIETTVQTFGPNSSRCRSFGLEIVSSIDTRTSGIRFCAQPPNPQMTKMVSDGNAVLLWLYRSISAPLSVTVLAKATCGKLGEPCPKATAEPCEGKTDNAKCAEWNANPENFCKSPTLSEEFKKQHCCKTCFLPTVPIADPCVGKTENAKCAEWNRNPEAFCKSPTISEAFKKQHCCKTCFPPTL